MMALYGAAARIEEEERVLFDATCRVLRTALELRQPDARTRATAMRDAYLQAARTAAQAAALKRAAGDERFVHASDPEWPTGVRGPSEYPSGAKLRSVSLTQEAERLEAYRDRQMARAEQIDALIQEFAKVQMHQLDEGPTPEACNRPGDEQSLRWLLDDGLIDRAHLVAARQIARTYEAVVSACMARIGRNDSAGRAPQGSWRGQFANMSDEQWDIYQHVYLPWTSSLSALDARILPITIDVVVEGRSLFATARQHHRSWNTIAEIVAMALHRWADLHADWLEQRQVAEEKARQCS